MKMQGMPLGTLAIQLAADEMKMIMQDGQTHHISTKKVFFFFLQFK